MEKIEEQRIYIKAILFGMLLALLSVMSEFLSLSAYFHIGLIASCALISLAKKGIFPFDLQGRVQNQLYWYTAAILTYAFPTSMLMNAREVLFWFPTYHRSWALLPFALLGIYCWKNDLVLPKRYNNKR
jgi:hypothetical protein